MIREIITRGPRGGQVRYRIRTTHVYPPIPIRSCDWSAVEDTTYDGPGCPHGMGATEAAAVDDLLTQLLERAE